MTHIPLHEAWGILGHDARVLMSDVAKLPRQERAAALRTLAEKARKASKQLLALHHPDKGGDPAKFKRVQEALSAVEHHTQEFERKAEEAAKRIAAANERRPVFIDVKKPR